MNKINKMRFKPLRWTLLLVALLAIPAMTSIGLAAQPTVNLGSTADFAVLAGSTITNTGSSVIDGSVGGDVGLYPGTAFTGQADVAISGTVHLADDVAREAKDDLVAAYNDAAGRTPVTRIPSELGGTVLTPGTYDSADGTFQITGTLTLDAQGDPDGVFVFQTDSTLITASNSNIKLINSARFCRTFWKVGSSATLGTNSHFVGHIFAMTSIAANTGATVQGQLLARNGAVTLDSNTITNGVCAADNDDDNSNDNGEVSSKPEVTTPPVNIDQPVLADTEYTTTTVNGGQLPKTSTPLYAVLLLGTMLMGIGFAGWINRKRFE